MEPKEQKDPEEQCWTPGAAGASGRIGRASGAVVASGAEKSSVQLVAVVSGRAVVAFFIAFLWGVSASGAVTACSGSLGCVFTRLTYGVVRSTFIWALRTARAADAIVSPHVGLVVASRAHVGLREGRWEIVTPRAAVHRGAAFLAVSTFRADFA